MARNEEKAQAMLNRFVTAKKDANREDKSQRPYLSTECNNVPDCGMYRNQIIKEISKKVSLIQNEGLEEHKVRDLNDAIHSYGGIVLHDVLRLRPQHQQPAHHLRDQHRRHHLCLHRLRRLIAR